LNPYVDITNAENLKAFYKVDYIFVVTAVTFKNSVRTIQVFDKINPPKFCLVRNQCDKF
jgi:NADH:ubiquinone oxidoreductase subunit B-like Fe-S oxidoreductase